MIVKFLFYFTPLAAGIVVVFFMFKPLLARRPRHAQPLALNPDKTFALSHIYADNGSYTVSITVSNPAGPGSGTTPSQYDTIIDSTLLARLPSPFARSAL